MDSARYHLHLHADEEIGGSGKVPILLLEITPRGNVGDVDVHLSQISVPVVKRNERFKGSEDKMVAS